MALAGSGSLSIKTAAGAGRSIAQEVDGNTTGNKSLSTLSASAGKSAPHGMTEFYGYTAPVARTITWETIETTTGTPNFHITKNLSTEVNTAFSSSGSFEAFDGDTIDISVSLSGSPDPGCLIELDGIGADSGTTSAEANFVVDADADIKLYCSDGIV